MQRNLAAVLVIGSLVALAIPLSGQEQKSTKGEDGAKQAEAPKDKAKAPEQPPLPNRTSVMRRLKGWEYKVLFSAIPFDDKPSQIANRVAAEFNNVANEGWEYAGNVFEQRPPGISGTFALFKRPRYEEVKITPKAIPTAQPPLIPAKKP